MKVAYKTFKRFYKIISFRFFTKSDYYYELERFKCFIIIIVVQDSKQKIKIIRVKHILISFGVKTKYLPTEKKIDFMKNCGRVIFY